ncbi:hypothetical protein MBLNU459_g6152t1 [Dothideomycetes sp. NU459]
MQTSISAWLRQPASVKAPPNARTITAPADDPPQLLAPPRPTPPPPQGTATGQTDHGQPQTTTTTTTATATTTTTTTSSASVPSPRTGASDPGQPPPPPFPFDKRPLVSNIRLEPCTPANISGFKRVNTLLLPIPYPAKFYDEILAEPVDASVTLLAIWRDDDDGGDTPPGRVIGGIRCRLLGPPSPAPPLLYISTLCVLSPYRSHGVATHLLRAVLATAIARYGVREVGGHVWEASEDAREWYRKRGFRETSKEGGYYRRLKPQTALVLRRDVGPRDLLGR